LYITIRCAVYVGTKNRHKASLAQVVSLLTVLRNKVSGQVLLYSTCNYCIRGSKSSTIRSFNKHPSQNSAEVFRKGFHTN